MRSQTGQHKAGWNWAVPDRAKQGQTVPDRTIDDRQGKYGLGAGYYPVGPVRPHNCLPGGPKETIQAHKCSWYS